MNITKYGYRIFGSNIVRRALKVSYQNHPRCEPVAATAFVACSTRKHSTWNTPKTPELIYVPHVIRWIKTKMKFKYLQKVWDPDFSEGAFIYGTTRAMCRITEILSENKIDELKNLVTLPVKNKLVDEAGRLTPLQRQIIRLQQEDIKILVPIQVNLIKDGIEKRCAITLRILALKWLEITGSLRLVLVALQSEFVRDYTQGSPPDWTISSFDILECAVLSKPPASSQPR